MGIRSDGASVRFHREMERAPLDFGQVDVPTDLTACTQNH